MDHPDQQPSDAPDTEEPQEGAPQQADADRTDELPDWARAKLSDANKEAARYRTQLREAQQALKAAKTPEEFEAVRADFTDQLTRLEREIMLRDVGAAHGLPPELWARLRGDTREDLIEDAKALHKLVQSPAPSRHTGGPRGGLNPTLPTDDVMNDPVKLAKAMRERRLMRGG